MYTLQKRHYISPYVIKCIASLHFVEATIPYCIAIGSGKKKKRFLDADKARQFIKCDFFFLIINYTLILINI